MSRATYLLSCLSLNPYFLFLLTQLPDFCQCLWAYELRSRLRESTSVCSFPLDLISCACKSLLSLTTPYLFRPCCGAQRNDSSFVVLSQRDGEKLGPCHCLSLLVSPCQGPSSHNAQAWGRTVSLEPARCPHSIGLPGRIELDSRTNCICPLAQSGPGVHRNNTHIHTTQGFASKPT